MELPHYNSFICGMLYGILLQPLISIKSVNNNRKEATGVVVCKTKKKERRAKSSHKKLPRRWRKQEKDSASPGEWKTA